MFATPVSKKHFFQGLVVVLITSFALYAFLTWWLVPVERGVVIESDVEGEHQVEMVMRQEYFGAFSDEEKSTFYVEMSDTLSRPGEQTIMFGSFSRKFGRQIDNPYELPVCAFVTDPDGVVRSLDMSLAIKYIPFEVMTTWRRKYHNEFLLSSILEGTTEYPCSTPYDLSSKPEPTAVGEFLEENDGVYYALMIGMLVAGVVAVIFLGRNKTLRKVKNRK